MTTSSGDESEEIGLSLGVQPVRIGHHRFHRLARNRANDDLDAPMLRAAAATLSSICSKSLLTTSSEAGESMIIRPG